MAKEASFVIKINGINESINAVDSLNKQLDALEKRIDNLSKRNVNISASGGNAKAFDEEAKMLQKIDELHQKVAASEKAEYQQLLHAKEELKEYQTIAKSIAAQENLKSGTNNLNTMQGMKAQLHDLKAAMQTVDVGGDQFKKWAAEANELTQKLKEIEASYGTFSRDVGNYANGVAEGMQKIVIKVGDTERTFESARDASRQLNNELKSMALNGQQGTKEYDELNSAVKQLNSTLKDVEASSAGMDNLLDTMQGITALASAGQGIASLFGVDDSEIEKSIQKLVALQNVLQGIETIRKQMQTQEGIGLILSKGNKAVDKMVASIFGIGTASKGATLAVKTLSTALKGIGIGLVVAAVSTLISKITDWVEKQEEAKKKAEELAKEENKLNATLQVQRVQLQNTLSSLEAFNGSKKEEQAIVKDLNSKYGQALGTYKTIAEWKDALKKKTDAYIESLKLEAQMQAAIKQLEDAYIKQREAENYDVGFWEGLFEGEAAVRTRVKAAADQAVKAAEDAVTDIAKRINENNRKNQINLFAPTDTKSTTRKVKENGKKVEDAVRQAETNINDLRLKLMRDGLAKSLMQLDENNRKEIEKIRKNGQKVEEQLRLQQQVYEQERKKILSDYSSETLEIVSDNQLRNIDAAIDKLNNLAEKQRKVVFIYNTPTSSKDKIGSEWGMDRFTTEQIEQISNIYKVRNNNWASRNFEPYIQELRKYYGEASDIIKEFQNLLDTKGKDNAYKWLMNTFENETVAMKNFLTKYGDTFRIENGKIVQSLDDSFTYYMNVIDTRYRESLDKTADYIKQSYEMVKSGITTNWQSEIDAVQKELSQLTNDFDSNVQNENETQDYYRELRDQDKDSYTEREQMMIAYVNRMDALTEKLEAINADYHEQIIKNELDSEAERQSVNQIYYQEQLTALDEFLQKAGTVISSQPQLSKLGFVDIKATKENYNEVLTLYKDMLDNITALEIDLNGQKALRNISSEQYIEIFRNLQFYKKKIQDETNDILKTQSGLGLELYKQIDFWIQQVGQAATQIIQSIGEINQAAFERQIEAIERQTEALEEQLDKQKELTQKYADDVNDIEDELENSRGDRRQFLIDQLNAQMQAQRESLAQEKQIEKEQERLAKKREQLEYENEMRKWRQSIATAAINAALSISNAAVNTWPIPAIPMMALATSVGAAQMAAVLANKPKKYADGGKLEGRSHAQGGIKVLGGQAEVEGGEFVTNKRTTSQNLALLQFINNKKKKIDLSDMIDFYSSKANKNISNTRKTYFADGGQIPVLRNDIDLSDRLITTMEKYSEKPTVVQVVDIINKAENLRQVQALAGLS